VNVVDLSVIEGVIVVRLNAFGADGADGADGAELSLQPEISPTAKIRILLNVLIVIIVPSVFF